MSRFPNELIEGDYQPSYATYRVVLHGLPGSLTATIDGQAIALTEVTLETGLKQPSLVVGMGFGEVRGSVVPPIMAVEVALVPA